MQGQGRRLQGIQLWRAGRGQQSECYHASQRGLHSSKAEQMVERCSRAGQHHAKPAMAGPIRVRREAVAGCEEDRKDSLWGLSCGMLPSSSEEESADTTTTS